MTAADTCVAGMAISLDPENFLRELRSGEWVVPFQTRELCKIAVARAQREAVLDSERGQMSVRDQPARGGRQVEQPFEHGWMLGRGQRNPHDIAREPLLYLTPCVGRSDRMSQDCRV